MFLEKNKNAVRLVRSLMTDTECKSQDGTTSGISIDIKRAVASGRTQLILVTDTSPFMC